MATDYVTSPTTEKGKLVFGIGLGVITCLIRFFGTMNEGVSFAILLMNLVVPYIEVLTRQDKLGIAKVADGTFGKADGSSTDGDAENDDVTLADRFRDMREDWRQLRIQRIEDAEERKAERKAARNGVTFESVSH